MKILIVEDEVNLAHVTAAMLTNHAYNVDIATDGETGGEKASSGIYDLVILDVMLPKKDGFEILEDIRALAPETKVIMLTARGELPDKLKGLKNGADDYMTKPFHMEELLARVDIQLKKNTPIEKDRLELGNTYLDLKSGMFGSKATGDAMPVSGKEYALLEYFSLIPTRSSPGIRSIPKSGAGITKLNPTTLKRIFPFCVKNCACWKAMSKLNLCAALDIA